MEQLEVQETQDKVYYSKGKFILFGNPELRDGKIVCQTFDTGIRNFLLIVLNKSFIFKK